MTHPVRWGILSTALIGTEKVIPAMRKSGALGVAAIASRDLSAAQAAAAKFGIATAYGTYEALLADPTIEAIYNPLPNHLHVTLTLAAARAGKHVLCEKPMALTAADLEVLRPYGVIEMVRTGRVEMARGTAQAVTVGPSRGIGDGPTRSKDGGALSV